MHRSIYDVVDVACWCGLTNMPCPTLPYPTLLPPCPTLSTMPCPAVPNLTLPCPALLYFSCLLYSASPACLSFPALPCHSIPRSARYNHVSTPFECVTFPSFLHSIDLRSPFHFISNLFLFCISWIAGHVAPLLSCLLQVMYITSDRLTEQKRERERERKGAYRAYKNKKSIAPSPSLSVPQSVPLPRGMGTGTGSTTTSMATTSKHLYTVCVCVLIIVNNPAVRLLLSTMTMTMTVANHHHHPAWMKHYSVNANSRVSRLRRRDACSCHSCVLSWLTLLIS